MNHNRKIAAVYEANASLLFVYWVGYEALLHLKKVIDHIFMFNIIFR